MLESCAGRVYTRGLWVPAFAGVGRVWVELAAGRERVVLSADAERAQIEKFFVLVN